MVVTISLKASNAVLFLKLEIIDEPLKELSLERHLLKSWEKTRLSWFRHSFLVSSTHVGVVPDI